MGSSDIITGSGGSSSSRKQQKAMWVYPNPMMAAAGFNPTTERWGHSSCYYNRLIYVFGGCCGGMHFSDVVALDVETLMGWSTISTTGQPPGPRDSHTAVLVGHKMVIFGGTTGFKKVNHLHILDLKSRVWTRPICGGVVPSPRESHTATLIDHHKLVVFGGSGEGEANYLSDLHILDLKTMIWTCPAVNGHVPVPRDSHCAVAVGSKLYVYGGDCGDRYQSDVNVLDIQTFTWFKLAIRGPCPGPRAGHAAFAITSKMYVIGGVGNKKYYNDVWVLDTNGGDGGGSWTRVEISGPQPQGRFSHTAVVVVANSDIVIYGGCGEDEHPLSELVVLRVRVESSHESAAYCVEKRKMQMDDFVRRWQNSCGDSMNAKKMMRRHPSNSKILVEIESSESESEAEEHSLSLSQHSSPSQSDQDQEQERQETPPLMKKTNNCTADDQSPNPMPTSFLRRRRQKQMQSLHNFVQTAPDHLNFLHETDDHQNQPKTVQHIRARLGTRVLDIRQEPVPEYSCRFADQKKVLETRSVNFPPMNVGAEVRGKIDGSFDSGYLMTATVNGRAYRGVLFAPPPPPTNSFHTHQYVFPNHNNHHRSNMSPLSNSIYTPNQLIRHPAAGFVTSTLPPECDGGGGQGHGHGAAAFSRQPNQVTGASMSSSIVAVREPKIRNDLKGVVLTLGGGACSSHAET